MEGVSAGMSQVCGSAGVGIYCRPGCSPRVDGVTDYPLAASAEAAGMRACLTCRPYQLPQMPARSGPQLVCQAVRMILAGVLDQGSEASLAGGLGVSARHLRRIFVAHLGVTPDALARSCRAHLARRLLDDTDISITEIAYMAGFGSIRQFNRDFLKTFRAAPSQLRAGRLSPGRLAADGGLTLRLWFAGPLDWDALLSFLAERAVPGVEDTDGRVYRRTIVIDGDPGVLELHPGGSDYLMLRFHLPYGAGLMHLTARARRIASLDDDISEPAWPLAADPLMRPLLASRPGIRVPGSWDPFEVGVAAILGQGVSLRESREIITRLVCRFGTPVPGLEPIHLTHTFPSSHALASRGMELQDIGLPASKSRAIMAYASAIESGALSLDGSTSGDQLISSIRQIPGITDSTAHYIALRMGEPDAFPFDDPILQRASERLTGRSDPALSRAWRPWRSYAASHLWAIA